MPGHANTVSTTTATLIMMTRLMPASVRTGINAFLNACLAMTRDSGSPLRRASLMYSEPSTSSIEERVRRICAAAKYQPSANAGMIRSEEHTSELQSHVNLVCRLLLEKKKKKKKTKINKNVAY